VNTTVVQALMTLRGIDEPTLANLAYVDVGQLRQWLAGQGENADEAVPFDRQLEILRSLGIHNEAPRADVVHHWFVREPFFGATGRIYWALNAVVEAFGRADVAFLARESDPAFTMRNQACFALKFERFRALLHVHGHPLRSLRFAPERFAGLNWMPGTYGVLLEASEYAALAPGRVASATLDSHILTGADAYHWERLAQAAREAQVSAEQLLAWVAKGGHNAVPRLAASAPAKAPRRTRRTPETNVVPGPAPISKSTSTATPTDAAPARPSARRGRKPREAATSEQAPAGAGRVQGA
jgi:hypothetical protein